MISITNRVLESKRNSIQSSEAKLKINFDKLKANLTNNHINSINDQNKQKPTSISNRNRFLITPVKCIRLRQFISKRMDKCNKESQELSVEKVIPKTAPNYQENKRASSGYRSICLKTKQCSRQNIFQYNSEHSIPKTAFFAVSSRQTEDCAGLKTSNIKRLLRNRRMTTQESSNLTKSICFSKASRNVNFKSTMKEINPRYKISKNFI